MYSTSSPAFVPTSNNMTLKKGFVPTLQGLEMGMALPISELEANQANARNSLASHAFSRLSFAFVPIDKPQESRDSQPMRSGEATLCKDAQQELSPSSVHVNKVPPTSLTSKKEAQDQLLKKCQAIWQAADGLSQADTASSESRRGSPQLMPSQPPQDIPNAFGQRQNHPVSPPRVQLSLKGLIKLPGDSKKVRENGASLATMLLRQDKTKQQIRPTQHGLPKEELHRLAQVVAADFQRNLGQTKPERRLSMALPPANESMTSLGQPAYAMLGYGGNNFGPSRSKAFSMQVQEVSCHSEEKKMPDLSEARLGSPQILPCKRASVRSLLLEPDMEDLTSIWPRTLDLNELNCPDEDAHKDRTPEHETEDDESRESCFSESIFCSGPLSALPLTQAV